MRIYIKINHFTSIEMKKKTGLYINGVIQMKHIFMTTHHYNLLHILHNNFSSIQIGPQLYHISYNFNSNSRPSNKYDWLYDICQNHMTIIYDV